MFLSESPFLLVPQEKVVLFLLMALGLLHQVLHLEPKVIQLIVTFQQYASDSDFP